ncbi:unnamed protein product, partial [Vitis vinifera]
MSVHDTRSEHNEEREAFASQGSPIILAQVENEYGHTEKIYGDGGKPYASPHGSFS